MRYPRAAVLYRLVGLFFVFALLLPAGARAQRIRTIARVIASSDVGGRFAHPVCDRDVTMEPSDHAAFTYALMREAGAEDEPMVVDLGGLLAPHGVARYAAEHDPASLAEMVDALGYRGLAFGLADLAAPRAPMIEVIRELRRRGVPVLASNLRCTPDAEALCRGLVDASDGPSIQLVNGRRTAVLAVLRENIGELVAPDRTRGVRFEPPRATLERLTRIARGQGAEIVIAVVDGGIAGGPIQLASELDEQARPDLLLVSGDDEILFARPTTVRPVLVGTPPGDAVEVRIRESEEIRQGYEMLAQPLGGRGITVAEPVSDWIEQIGEPYCEAWGRPLAGAHLSAEGEMTPAAMLALVAEVVREAADADVAVLNRQALDARWRPAHANALTASDVYIALQYDEPLQVAEVDERWLKSLAGSAAASDSLVTPGLTWTMSGGSVSGIKIGGHPSESRATYRVVTIRFLAAGGDAAVPTLLRGEQWVALGDATLRTAVLEFLEHPRDADPRDAVDDPADTLEWVFRTDATLTFSGSTITNPRRRCAPDTPPAMCVGGLVVDDAGATSAAYGTTQLAQSDVLTFGLALDLAANAAAPDWTWQNTGSVLYSTAWTEPAPGNAGGFVEASDQVRVRSTLSWRGLRQEVENGWYVPDPTVDLFVESELSEPPGRDWHWLLTRPTLGLRFQLLDKLQLQLSGGFQTQPFDPDTANDPIDAGVGGTLTLAPWDFLSVDRQYARLSFTFDYFLADLGDTNAGALRGQLEASLELVGPLALTVRFNMLLQHEELQDVGAAVQATAGVRLGYLGRATGP